MSLQTGRRPFFHRAFILVAFTLLLAACSPTKAMPPQLGNSTDPVLTEAAMTATATAQPTLTATTAQPKPTDIIAAITSAAMDPAITDTPEPTQNAAPTKKPTAKPAPKATTKPYTLPYVIYVEKGSHTITVYGKATNGKYSNVVKQFLTATGSTPMRTPTGTFHIRGKERWHRFGGESYAQYATAYASGLYFHSPIYTAKDNNTLIVSSYRAIGTNATAGCMRTYTGAAHWIYANCAVGTRVEIVNGSPRGTGAGKPPAVSDTATYDPTDPNKPASTPAPTVPPAATATPSESPGASPTAEPTDGDLV